MKIGEKFSAAYLRKMGIMPPTHKFAKSTNKWKLVDSKWVRTDSWTRLLLTFRGSPKTKTGNKRAKPLKISLYG